MSHPFPTGQYYPDSDAFVADPCGQGIEDAQNIESKPGKTVHKNIQPAEPPGDIPSIDEEYTTIGVDKQGWLKR